MSRERDAGTVIANADWGFEYRPLTVIQSQEGEVRPGRAVVDVGPLLTLRLYSIIPIKIFTGMQLSPYIGVPGQNAASIGPIADSAIGDDDGGNQDDGDDTESTGDDEPTPTTCASGISNARITELSRTSTAIRVYFAYDGDSSCGTPDDVDLNAWVNDGSFSDTQVITARRISSFSTDSSGRYLSVPIADLDGEGLDWDVYF